MHCFHLKQENTSSHAPVKLSRGHRRLLPLKGARPPALSPEGLQGVFKRDTPQTGGWAPSPFRGAEHRYASYRPGPTAPSPGTSESPLGPARAARRGRSRCRARPFPAAAPALEESSEGAVERRRGLTDLPPPRGTRPLTCRASSDDLVRSLLQKAAGLPSHSRGARGSWRLESGSRDEIDSAQGGWGRAGGRREPHLSVGRGPRQGRAGQARTPR